MENADKRKGLGARMRLRNSAKDLERDRHNQPENVFDPLGNPSPPHPGTFIREVYLEPNGVNPLELAKALRVPPSKLTCVLKGTSRVSAMMALRLSVSLGRSPESWLAMQAAYDLWTARQSFDERDVGKLELALIEPGN